MNQCQNTNNEHSNISQSQLQSISYELSKPLRLYFCGHSLGAALAVLAALDVSVNMNYIVDAIKTTYENASHDNVGGIDRGKKSEGYRSLGSVDGRTEVHANCSINETNFKASKGFPWDVRWEVPTLAVYTYGGE
jgi:hypothetical protein